MKFAWTAVSGRGTPAMSPNLSRLSVLFHLLPLLRAIITRPPPMHWSRLANNCTKTKAGCVQHWCCIPQTPTTLSRWNWPVRFWGQMVCSWCQYTVSCWELQSQLSVSCTECCATEWQGGHLGGNIFSEPNLEGTCRGTCFLYACFRLWSVW